MLERFVCSLSGRPEHLHKLDMDGLLCIDCLLQSLDSGVYRIPCSCRRSSCHTIQQTLVMSQRRHDVGLVRSLQTCSVVEDLSFRAVRTTAAAVPALGTTPNSNGDTLHTSILSVASVPSASFRQGDRIRDAGKGAGVAGRRLLLGPPCVHTTFVGARACARMDSLGLPPLCGIERHVLLATSQWQQDSLLGPGQLTTKVQTKEHTSVYGVQCTSRQTCSAWGQWRKSQTLNQWLRTARGGGDDPHGVDDVCLFVDRLAESGGDSQKQEAGVALLHCNRTGLDGPIPTRSAPRLQHAKTQFIFAHAACAGQARMMSVSTSSACCFSCLRRRRTVALAPHSIVSSIRWTFHQRLQLPTSMRYGCWQVLGRFTLAF